MTFLLVDWWKTSLLTLLSSNQRILFCPEVIGSSGRHFSLMTPLCVIGSGNILRGGVLIDQLYHMVEFAHTAMQYSLHTDQVLGTAIPHSNNISWFQVWSKSDLYEGFFFLHLSTRLLGHDTKRTPYWLTWVVVILTWLHQLSVSWVPVNLSFVVSASFLSIVFFCIIHFLGSFGTKHFALELVPCKCHLNEWIALPTVQFEWGLQGHCTIPPELMLTYRNAWHGYQSPYLGQY